MELLMPLVEKIYAEATIQIDGVDPKVHRWKAWNESGFGRLYANDPLVEREMNYINDAHDALDHRDYHLKCFEKGFALLFMEISSVLDYKLLQGREQPMFWLRYFTPDVFRNYREIWDEVSKLVDKGIIHISEQDIRWRRYKSGYYWREKK